jgi:quercetin dioxygenase-like cupin family protein
LQSATATTLIVNIDRNEEPVLNVFGPTVQFLTAPSQPEDTLCVMKGVIPPGISVPLHSHTGIECFYMISGQQEVLIETDDQGAWKTCRAGDFIQIPSGVKHAFLNQSGEPAVSLISTTAKLGEFFKAIGRPVDPRATPMPPAPPTQAQMQYLVQVAARYGYWLATPEENVVAAGYPHLRIN